MGRRRSGQSAQPWTHREAAPAPACLAVPHRRAASLAFTEQTVQPLLLKSDPQAESPRLCAALTVAGRRVPARPDPSHALQGQCCTAHASPCPPHARPAPARRAPRTPCWSEPQPVRQGRRAGCAHGAGAARRCRSGKRGHAEAPGAPGSAAWGLSGSLCPLRKSQEKRARAGRDRDRGRAAACPEGLTPRVPTAPAALRPAPCQRRHLGPADKAHRASGPESRPWLGLPPQQETGLAAAAPSAEGTDMLVCGPGGATRTETAQGSLLPAPSRAEAGGATCPAQWGSQHRSPPRARKQSGSSSAAGFEGRGREWPSSWLVVTRKHVRMCTRM